MLSYLKQDQAFSTFFIFPLNFLTQTVLVYIFLTEQSVKNIITSLKYIQYSVDNNCRNAQLFL